MKIINWFKNRSGKMALSLAQGIGAAAVVGVAGIAAYQMFSSPAVNPDTVFSSQDDDVVYVAGGSSGAYSGVGYGENSGGEVQSGIRVKKSRGMELMEQDALRMKEQPQQTQLDRDEQEVQDFAMGKTTGLGMGQNEANEVNIGKNGDVSGVNAQIAAISAMAEQQKKEAQEKAESAGEAGDVARAAQAALGKGGSSKGWGNMNAGIARANGNNLNSESLQAGGPGSKRGGVLGGKGREADRLAMANKPVGFSSSRDEFLKARQRYAGDTLDDMAKMSASFKDGPHATNEATTSVFMSGGSGTHALSLGDSAVSSLGDTSSDDFTGASLPDLSGAADLAKAYAEAKQQLYKDLEKFKNKIAISAGIAGVFAYIWTWSYNNDMKDTIKKFKEQWADTEMESGNTQGSFADGADKVREKLWQSQAGWFVVNPGYLWGEFKKKYWAEGQEVAKSMK